MRKTASILMAIIVLLTGIHLSIASHLCQGRVVNVNFSITGTNVSSCCMKGDVIPSPSGKTIKTHCCVNELTTLTVDSNYSPSYFKNIDVSQKVIHTSGVLLKEIVSKSAFTQNSHSTHSPPGIYLINAVELADICVFRI
jgi:hypothetical protein